MADDPNRRADLVEWEQLADRFIAEGSGMSAMVHPWTNAPSEPPFRVWSDGARVRLTGSVDTFTADRLATVLGRTPVEGAHVVLDLTGLEFVDAAATRVIARWATELRASSGVVHLEHAPRFFVRVWRLLGFDQAPVATFAEIAG